MTNTLPTPRNGFTRRGLLRLFGQTTFGLASAMVGGIVSGHAVRQLDQNILAAPSAPRTGVAVAPTTITTANGLKVHHIQTGFVAVKQVHRNYNGPDGMGILAIATAREWTEWMPITVWVIEHPEGLMLIDTGDTPQASDPSYYECDPMSGAFYNSFLQFSVTPEEEIHTQLATLGIKPQDVRWVVQTHLHGDHVHGIRHFAKSEIFVSPLDYPSSLGAVPCLYPSWLNPTLVQFKQNDLAGFQSGYTLTKAEDVIIVPTPGHSNGHQSVILRDSERSYFFAGDTSFDEAQLLNNGIAGIAADATASRTTLANIRAYCASQPTVYLPSHDHASSSRLMQKQVVTV